MAERLRSAIESLFNVRDETNALAPSGDERRRKRNEFIEALRIYAVPILLLIVGAAVIALAVHFLVWSLVAHVIMPLVYAGVPELEQVLLAGSSVLLGQFISYLIYAACMFGVAVVALRAVLAKPRGYVRERTRTCLACGMTVLEAATKCRFCGAPLPGRRGYSRAAAGSVARSRESAPVLSSTSSASRDDDESRRRRRGGRRRGGRGRSRSGPGTSSDAGTSSSSGDAGSSRSTSNGGSR